MKAVVIPGSLPLATPVINGTPQVLQIWDFENMVGENLYLSGPRSLKCFVSNLPSVALHYPHLHIILSRLCISISKSLGVPWMKRWRNTLKILLLFPSRLQPFLAVLSYIFFSYLNMNSLLFFFYFYSIFHCLLLVFAFLCCWCDIPERTGWMPHSPNRAVCSCWTSGTEYHSLLFPGDLLRAEMTINK